MFYVEAIVAIAICVVLPVLIVFIIGLVRKNETNRKAEIMLKAIEAGVPIDAEVFKKPGKRPKTIKEDLLEKFNGACITGFMGIVFLVAGIVFNSHPIGKNFMNPTWIIVAGGVMMAVGTALLVTYFVGKKMLAKEMEAEEKTLK